MKRKRSIDQLTIAKIVATRMGMNLNQVSEIIETEQKTTMSYVKRGYRVVKKNYLTIFPTIQKAKALTSPLNNKSYLVPEKTSVRVRVGMGFKSYVSNKGAKMPNRLCRFVKDVKVNENLTLESAKQRN
jgi:phage-related protein